MPRAKRPEWKAERGGFGAPPLPRRLHEELRGILLESPLDADSAAAFIETCADRASILVPGREEPSADSKIWNSVEDLRKASIKLLEAMRALPPEATLELQVGWKLVAWRAGWRAPDKRADKVRAMPLAWDLIEAMRDAAIEATARVVPKRGKKAGADQARELVFWAATVVVARTGRLPPRTKGKWFHNFVHRLGRHFKLACGDDLVREVVVAMSSNASSKSI